MSEFGVTIGPTGPDAGGSEFVDATACCDLT
jgi:hypothetical protein